MDIAFLSELLEEYGQPRVRYAGTGELINQDHTASVDWTAAQYDDGQVLLACQGDGSAFGVFFTGPERFNGRNNDGVSFSSDRQIGELPFLRDVPHDETGSWAVYRLTTLHVEFPVSGPPKLIRYLITNFEFDARDGRRPVALDLSGVNGTATLRPLVDDTLATHRLRALRSPRPTAWLEIPPQDGQPDAALRIANDICSLLSIARGTKVTWIQEEVIDSGGSCCHLTHAHGITKPFTPLAPIHPRLIGNTREFLEATYPIFVERRDVYRLNHGTIDLVLDAKIETDFLETRGAKLAVALEALKQNVLVAFSPDVEYYTSPGLFTGAIEEMAGALKTILIRAGAGSDAANAITRPQRLLSLNRRSFSNLLRRVSKQLDLKLKEAELELFVRCRNSLVHRGDFYCVAASPKERDEVPPKATKFEEYVFLISVVDAFLLRLVGYRGPYLVRTGGSDWEKRFV